MLPDYCIEAMHTEGMDNMPTTLIHSANSKKHCECDAERQHNAKKHIIGSFLIVSTREGAWPKASRSSMAIIQRLYALKEVSEKKGLDGSMGIHSS
mmetsp:Transcript_29679/g.88045  ORF Transcript_29679/g.88045 Transcript_29679/m.88045 type:complete len:96 (+) Transcript_29679:1396-1683(+)